MIADVTSNTELHPVLTELFIWDWKLNISLVFNTQSVYFLTKYVRLNTLYLFFMKIPKMFEVRQISIAHQFDSDFKDIELYKKYTAESYSVLLIDNTLELDHSLHF